MSTIHTIEIAAGDSIVILIDGKPVAVTSHKGSGSYQNSAGEIVKTEEFSGKTFVQKDHYVSTGCFSAGSSLRVSEITIEGITAAINS